MKTTKSVLRKGVAVSTFLPMFVLSLGVGQGARCYAQTPTQPDAQPKVSALSEPLPSDASGTKSRPSAAVKPAAKTDAEMTADVAKELEAMKARIEELEAELKSRAVAEPAAAPATAPATTATPTASSAPTAQPATAAVQQASDTAAKPGKPEPAVPFAYADWTWLNGNPRNKDVVWDSKFFTPEIRMDIHYVQDLNHPKDDTMGGSTEIFRSNEIQVEQISFGGNFHWQNVNARILTMNGMFGITTPRNDASAGRG
ncbi:MAG: hypothetical protein WA653_19785, partial [Candidatus Sulfotelmatobacter sp.]